MIVHGGWGGGWEWAQVASLLAAGGHRVLTPTLTGLGERAHLAVSERIGLAWHADDVVAVLEAEDVSDVVLCGHSYGGAPVTLAGDRVPERLRSIVYLDAIVPAAGESVLDLVDDGFRALVMDGLDRHGPAWRLPIPDALLPVGGPDTERRRYIARLRDHPAATFIDPLATGAAVEAVSRVYVRFVERSGVAEPEVGDPTRSGVRRAVAEGWRYLELQASHDAQLTDPHLVAAALERLA